MVAANFGAPGRASVPRQISGVRTLPVMALGMALGLFLVISYLICITPGFELLNWQSFFLGLVESFAWGWYVALIFGPLYNFFALRWP